MKILLLSDRSEIGIVIMVLSLLYLASYNEMGYMHEVFDELFGWC